MGTGFAGRAAASCAFSHAMRVSSRYRSPPMGREKLSERSIR